ncbi:hypothetical protein K438DRAFT_1976982 [Mycena galopus ATCC 62051]|nr:hypothetical protein K438DRAFT_1976982 [Mycena galopus ATCC 62051]
MQVTSVYLTVKEAITFLVIVYKAHRLGLAGNRIIVPRVGPGSVLGSPRENVTTNPQEDIFSALVQKFVSDGYGKTV